MVQTNVINLIREVFSVIDLIVYSLIATAYNLIEEVTRYRIFTANEDFLTNKIYTLLSIFMLFKVSFSFINYLVNPDSFTDKEKGVQKIVLNIVIMFILLVISPWAFKQMWNLQDALLKENVIAQFVFGKDDTTIQNQLQMWEICDELNAEPSTAKTNGDYISLMILRTFYKPYDHSEIGHNVDEDDWDKEMLNHVCTSRTEAIPAHYLNPVLVVDTIDDGTFNILWIGDQNIYLMDYTFLVSTIVGGVVLLILVGFAMDVGLRLVKLSFLQLIAPIPIVSYVEPSSSKNGMFIKWLKEVGLTWASVFIRLFALFFAVRIIQEIDGLIPIDEDYPAASVWVKLAVIIGVLMFAKQLPKLISDISGIKLDGGFNINPMKKLEDETFGGFGARAVRGVGGLAIGGALGAVAGQGAGHTAWSALRSAGAGLFGNQRLGDIRRNQAEYNRRMDTARRNGADFGGRFRAGVSEFLGTRGELGDILAQEEQFDRDIRNIDVNDIDPLKEQMRNIDANEIAQRKEQVRNLQEGMRAEKNQIADQDQIISAAKNYIDVATKELTENRAGNYSVEYNELLLNLQKMESDYETNPNTIYTLAQIARERQRVAARTTEIVNNFMDDRNSGNNAKESAFRNYVSTAQSVGTQYGEHAEVYADNIRAQRGRLLNSNSNLKDGHITVETRIESINREIQTFETQKADIQYQINDFENQKADIKQQKDALQEAKRTAQANSDHRMHGPHMGGGPGGRH